MVKGVGQRRIQLPAKSVVHSERGFDFPTVLRKDIDAGIAYILPLRRALRVAIVQAQQVAGVIIVVGDGIFGRTVKSIFKNSVSYNDNYPGYLLGLDETEFSVVLLKVYSPLTL